MGLDMYLKAELYVSGYEHSGPEERAKYDTLLRIAGLQGVADREDAPSVEVRTTVAYWRKANAIHRWFVENVQEGRDDCRDYYVEREQLEALRDTCRKVLAVARVAEGQPVKNGETWSKSEDGQIKRVTTSTPSR